VIGSWKARIEFVRSKLKSQKEILSPSGFGYPVDMLRTTSVVQRFGSLIGTCGEVVTTRGEF
jgi:hypothetical protein